MKAKRDSDRASKRTCRHQHPKGDTHCVWIQERSGPGYILCQMNQCIIRPEPAPKVSHGRGPDGKEIWVDYDGDDIYDTNEFNRLWQTLAVERACSSKKTFDVPTQRAGFGRLGISCRNIFYGVLNEKIY